MMAFCGQLSCITSTPVFLTCGYSQALAVSAFVQWSLNPHINLNKSINDKIFKRLDSKRQDSNIESKSSNKKRLVILTESI